MMKKTEKTNQKNQEESTLKERIKHRESEPIYDQANGLEQETLGVVETPFQPPVARHAALLAKARQGLQRANLILNLQRTYGNAYVQRLLKTHAIQAELTISQADDIFEQEAERVSEIVTRNINSQVDRQSEEEEESVQRQDEEELEETASKSLIQRQDEEELEEAASKSLIQRQDEEELEEAASKSLIQRQDEEELEEAASKSMIQRQDEEELEEAASKSLIQRQDEEELEEATSKSLIQRQDEEELEEAASKSLIQRQTATVADDLETRIENARGNGQPLSDDIREPMEQAFGADFSSVKVHNDTEADVLNQELNARAFTTGQDIFFRQGEYSPGSGSGQKLIAHELTHVVQQNGAGASRQNLEKKTLDRLESVKRQTEEEAGNEEGGDLPDQELEEEEEVEKGPGEGQMYDATALKSSALTSIPDSDLSTQPKISIGSVGFEFTNSGTRTVDSSNREESEESGKAVSIDWHNPGGETVSPFGTEFFKPSWKNASYTKSWLGNIKLDFTIDVNCPWGTNDGGRKDVPSGSDAIVTKDTYKDIVKDMTPFKKEKCWVSPFSKYWSKAIVERHEKLHSTDDKTWSEGAGRTVVISYLNGKPAPRSNVVNTLRTYLDNSMVEMRRANTTWYKGGAASYWSYTGEERAFGDGKVPSEELATAVKKQGEKLEQEAQK